jgi:hypothetical protein
MLIGEIDKEAARTIFRLGLKVNVLLALTVMFQPNTGVR